MNQNSSTTDITLAQMESLCSDAFDLKEKIKTLENEAAELSKELTKLKSQIILGMEAANLTRFTSGHGRIEMVETYNASLPDNPDDRKQVFELMKEAYGPEFMANKLTLYAKSIESLVKEAMEEAAQEGHILNEFFGLPIKQHRYIKLV